MIGGLHHIAVICAEEERSLCFYRDALGFGVTARHERPERGDVILMLEQSGVTLELFIDVKHPPRVDRPEAMGLRHLALRVDDVPAMAERLAGYGYICEPLRTDTFTGERMTFVKDPDGLPVELHE